jgi:Tfp pilus assembly protein PilF
VIAKNFSGTESTDPNVMAALNEIGILYSHQKKMAEAEAMYQRALAGKEKAHA